VKGDSQTEKKCIGTFSDERDTEVYKIIQKWEGDGPAHNDHFLENILYNSAAIKFQPMTSNEQQIKIFMH
jgi:hypothetical protein